MRKLRGLLLVPVIAGVCAAVPVIAQNHPPVVTLPEPSEGNVEGRQGISFWPLWMIDGEERPVDPAGCVVHLVPPDVDARITHACGKWFAPPPDRYSVWLEQGNRVSDQTVINSGGTKFFDDGVVVVMTMNEAGFATIAADVAVNGDKTARLLTIEPSSAGFEKRLQPPEAHSTNRLPAGKAIAGVFGADGEALALSRPFTMKHGQTTVVTPRAPRSGTDLMLVLGKRLGSPADRMARSTRVSAVAGGDVHEPDVFYETNGRIVAIWYGMTARTAKLRMQSNLFRLGGETEIRLTPGTVTTVREELELNTTGVIR
jgi:hypothetical protein